jgi:hypothetical protein
VLLDHRRDRFDCELQRTLTGTHPLNKLVDLEIISRLGLALTAYEDAAPWMLPELLTHGVDRVAVLRWVDDHYENLVALHRHVLGTPLDRRPNVALGSSAANQPGPPA